jgi:chromosomal replication initiation ATPase DnaA
MKQEVFNQYTKKVTSKTKVAKSDLFTTTKKRDVVDARQMLFWLCRDAGISVSYIQKYAKINGLTISHSSIIWGVNRMSEMMETDDYVNNLIQSLA